MKAMILAAGRGERMRPLTDQTPKPLLTVGGRPLIVWHLLRMARCGIREVTINLAHLGHQIESALGPDAGLDLRIRYSHEPEGALETAGGIATARPWAGAVPLDLAQTANDWFLVVNGDVYTDWPFERACELAETLADSPAEACLMMVPNPAHHPQGDFQRAVGAPADQPAPLFTSGETSLSKSMPDPLMSLTYSGIGLYRPSLFAQTPAHQRAPLAPLLRAAADRGQLLSLVHEGQWTDVGTPERLNQLDQQLRHSAPCVS